MHGPIGDWRVRVPVTLHEFWIDWSFHAQSFVPIDMHHQSFGGF